MSEATGSSKARSDGDAEIRDLIARAEAHPLGQAFLRDGALDAVAATFGVHAFAVDRARDFLNGGGQSR